MDEMIRSAAYDMIYLAGCAVNRLVPELIRIGTMDLESVFTQSCSHNISTLIYSALESAREKNMGSSKASQESLTKLFWEGETYQKWKQENDRALYQNVRLGLEREKVLAFLEDAGIWYMPLKGIVLQDFYPESYLRQAVDNDILYDPVFQKSVHHWFLQRGYRTIEYKIWNVDSYQKTPCYNFEMHRSLFEQYRSKWFLYYEDVKRRLIPNEGNQYGFHFTDEDFYVYYIIHGYKHDCLSGIGLLFMLDIYLYIKSKKDALDWTYIHRELSLLDADEFEEKARGVAWKIFGDPLHFWDAQLSKEERDFLVRCLESGVHGNLENRLASSLKNIDPSKDRASGWLKFRYAVRRAFPDEDYMKSYWPVAAKHKWLIPVGYIYRFFRSCFGHHSRIRSELKALRKMPTAETSELTEKEITVTEKPASISFEDIYQAVWEPLEDRQKDRDTFLSEWKQSIAKEGECFVAMYGDEIVGTLSVTMRKRDCWYAKEMVPFCLYVRVASEWQGHHICSGLMEQAVEYAEAHECDIVDLKTGAANRHAIKVYRHLGFRAVKLIHPKHRGYSIRMAKFLKEEPHGIRLRLTDTAIRILLPFYRAARKVYHLFRRRK